MSNYQSPDILSEQCISAYLMKELPETTSDKNVPKTRNHLARKAKAVGDPHSKHNDKRIKRQCKRPLIEQEQNIDDQKHARAMEVLYHLQQRQEQVFGCFKEFSDCNIEVEPLEAELKAIGEALTRLTRIFKLAKDELNNSQYYPCDSKDLRTKQLQMNTRLIKCASLCKVQEDLKDEFEKIQQQILHNSSDMNISDANSEEKSLACSDETNSILSIASPTFNVTSVPFSQPCYSQQEGKPAPTERSHAQSILDEIFGRDDSMQSISIPHNIPLANVNRHPIIGQCNGKMFASPPRPTIHTTTSPVMSSTLHKQHNESLNESTMNATGVFEPSQKETNWCTNHNLSVSLFVHATSSSIDAGTAEFGTQGTASVAGEPLATSTQVLQKESKTDCRCSTNGTTKEPSPRFAARRLLYIESGMKVNVISDNQLENLMWDAQGCSIGDKLLNTIDCWN